MSVATPVGPLRRELVATTLAVAVPAWPGLPAKTVSAPAGVTLSTRLAPASAMNTSPLGATATPAGLRSGELVAGPAAGVPRTPLPARIERVRSGVTFSTKGLPLGPAPSAM